MRTPNTIIKLTGIALVLAVLAGWLSQPVQASTASVSDSTTLKYRAASGEKNKLVIGVVPPNPILVPFVPACGVVPCLVVGDPGAEITANSPCAKVDLLVASGGLCPPLLRLNAKLGNKNDEFRGSPIPTTVELGPGNDSAKGGILNDTIDGGSGNDKIRGGTFDDKLRGRAGDDTLEGESGKDNLRGGDGKDVLKGGDGDDRLSGGQGRDTLDCGAGNDTADASSIDTVRSNCENVI